MREGWEKDKLGCMLHLFPIAVVLGSSIFCIIKFS